MPLCVHAIVLRALACVLLCGAACARPALASGKRPVGAPSGEVVAVVHLRIGATATLIASGRSFPAVPGTALLRADELVVPPSAVLVVELRNGYLVRLDDDLRLPVGKIVLIDAPRTEEPLGRQLDRLLTREEQGRAERIAGTRSSEAAAETDAPSGGGGGASSSRRPAVESGRAEQGGSKQEPMHPRVVVPRAPAPAQKPRPMAPVTLPDPTALKRCLRAELEALPVRISSVTLRLRVKGGRISGVALGGGLVTPPCALRLLIGAPYVGEEGRWLEQALQLR